jgi:murein DD-endopeptidase MepM/ murein hydrolase activator NlpD
VEAVSGSHTSRATSRVVGGLLLVAAGACQVVKEVGRDTVQVQVVDTVARVDTVVQTDTVVIRDSLSALGDELAASALAALGGDSALAAAAAPGSTPATAPTTAPAVAPAAGTGASPAAVAGAMAAAVVGAPPAPTDTTAPVVTSADLTLLHAKRLLMPVAGLRAANVPDTFSERRGSRAHEALDILAPRGTAVLSTDASRVAKLYTSKAGGLTLYAADSSGRFMYYYAHLDRYHPRMREGLTLARGDTIGFVGVTGNAAPTVPHLHFAIARIANPSQWWRGTPVNPHTLLTDQ